MTANRRASLAPGCADRSQFAACAPRPASRPATNPRMKICRRVIPASYCNAGRTRLETAPLKTCPLDHPDASTTHETAAARGPLEAHATVCSVSGLPNVEIQPRHSLCPVGACGVGCIALLGTTVTANRIVVTHETRPIFPEACSSVP